MLMFYWIHAPKSLPTQSFRQRRKLNSTYRLWDKVTVDDLVDERFQLIQFTTAVALTSAHTIELMHYMLLLPVPKELQRIHLFKDCHEGKNVSETDRSQEECERLGPEKPGQNIRAWVDLGWKNSRTRGREL